MGRSIAELRAERIALGLRQDFIAETVLGYTSTRPGNRLHDYEIGRRVMPEADRARLERYLVRMRRAHEQATARVAEVAS